MKLFKKSSQPTHYAKQRPGYVNPFKHQQDLEQQRLVKQFEEVKQRAQAQKQQPKPAPPPPPPPPPRHQPAAHAPKKPSLFDKKFEITIKKPSFIQFAQSQPLKASHTAPQPQHVIEPQPVKEKPVPPLPPIAAPKPEPQPVHTTPQVTVPKPEPKPPVQHHPEQVHVPPVNPTALRHKEPESVFTKPPRLKKPTIKLRKPKKEHAVAAVAVVGVVLLGALAAVATNTPEKQPAPTVQQTAKQNSPAAELAQTVGKKVALPQNEKPTSATVEDKTKLQDQPFFKLAENGDKVLIYKQNKKVFLYRPSTDEVIAEAPLDMGDVAGAAVSPAVPLTQ